MESPKKSAPQSEDIDLMRYLSLFASNWIWFAIALFLAFTMAYIFNRYTPRVYNVKSTLLIEEAQSTGGIADLEKLMPSGDYYGSWRNLENEIAILESYALNYRVMEEMQEFHIAYVPLRRHGFSGQRMYKTSPFVVRKLSDNQPSGVKMTIKFTGKDTYTIEVDEDDIRDKKLKVRNVKEGKNEYSFGDVYSEYGFNFTVDLRDSTKSSVARDSRFLVWFESPASLANQYRSRLTIKPTKEGASVFTLSYNGYSPEQGADYLNTLMELYGKQGLELKTRAAENTITFIEEQLGFISDSLSNAENSMEKFRLNNRFVDLTLEGSLVLQKLEKLENEKNSLQLQLQYYEYLLEYIDSHDETGSIISPSVMGVTDPVLVKLVEDLSVMQQRKKQLTFSMKDELPQVEAADSQIERVRASLRENVASAISQLKLTDATINDRISAVEKDLGRLPGTERKLIGIQRKFDLNNSVYNFLLERRAEAGIARASQMSDNRVIDRAVPRNSSLISPRTMKNYMIAIVFGLMLPMLLILLLDLLNNKIIGRHDIESITKAPIIGFISHSDYTSDVPVMEKPNSTLAESFRAVRTSLSFYTGQTKCPVFIVSSPVSGEGKTFVSVNLASIIAMMNKKVLIVGLDMRKPRVQTILARGNGNGLGMSNYLSMNADFNDVIVSTDVPNLWFALPGPTPPNPAELIGSPRMAEFIHRARSEYDTIIIDTPPVGIVTDALLLGSFANVTLFVVRQRYSTKASVELLDEIYRNGEMTNVAMLVNDISASGYYGYGLRYGYTLGYGHRYYDPGNYGVRHNDKAAGYYKND